MVLPTQRSKRRSTSASPARAASTTVRSRPIWPPTRRSFGRGITSSKCARAPPTAWDRSCVGPGTRLYAPGLANLAMSAPGLSGLAKRIGGIAEQRRMPRFTNEAYRAWRRRHPARNGGERVILWPDTFNNYFRPDTAVAATRLLEGLGFQVDIPAAPLCCGRPLYDWGWVDQAKALWRNTLGAMAEDIRSGDPIIGLEPACVSAFRDELPNLFPGDAQAQALSKQTRFLTEFLKDRGLSPAAPDSHAPLLVQFHCHHHSVLDKKAESELIKALPAPSQVLQHGCCGMAGAFGFEVAKYASLARSPSTACCRTSPTRRKTRSSSPMASAAARDRAAERSPDHASRAISCVRWVLAQHPGLGPIEADAASGASASARGAMGWEGGPVALKESPGGCREASFDLTKAEM